MSYYDIPLVIASGEVQINLLEITPGFFIPYSLGNAKMHSANCSWLVQCGSEVICSLFTFHKSQFRTHVDESIR